MYRNAGLGTVVFLGILLIIKMAVIGNRAKPKFAPDFTPNATRGTAPDPNAPRTDLANTTDPATVAPKHDPAEDAPKHAPVNVAGKHNPDDIRGANFDPNFRHFSLIPNGDR
jgi:hypothetical protein